MQTILLKLAQMNKNKLSCRLKMNLMLNFKDLTFWEIDLIAKIE